MTKTMTDDQRIAYGSLRSALANLCTLVGTIEVPRIDTDPEAVAEEIITEVNARTIRANDKYGTAREHAAEAAQQRAKEIDQRDERIGELTEACTTKDQVIQNLKDTLDRRGTRYDLLIRDCKAYQEFMDRRVKAAIRLVHTRGERLMEVHDQQVALDTARRDFEVTQENRDIAFEASRIDTQSEIDAMVEEDARCDGVNLPTVANEMRVQGNTEEDIDRIANRQRLQHKLGGIMDVLDMRVGCTDPTHDHG